MAYLCIDVGGTKTLVARVSDDGVIEREEKFPTPQEYSEFLRGLEKVVANFTSDDIRAVGIGAPGDINYETGVGVVFGNLPWRNVPIRSDVEKLTGLRVAFENDANLAGLSEAMLRKNIRKVLYVTISTGIGTGYVVDGKICPATAASEGGHMVFERAGDYIEWENFASGRAIVERYGKRAEDIHDNSTWAAICKDLAPGFVNLCAVLQPDIIVVGGSVGTYFDRYGDMLNAEMQKLTSHMVRMPQLEGAGRAEKAVIYGCYDLAKSLYG